MKSKQEPKQPSKLVAKAKWLLYSGVALNTALLFAALADPPKNPRWTGE